ncbi:MAG: response regulator transcription factor [Candidatus Omnitrophica bacterium]|nr:response regulator transcription factor [Candidatus Omnitrophota bacterium]
MPSQILLVDDDPKLLEMAEKYLTGQGFEVVTVGDGEKALERIWKVQPDLIILDLILPGMNGYSICSTLKKDPRFKNIPVIIFSQHIQETEEEIKLLCGADACLQKPFRGAVLMSKIQSLLKPPSEGSRNGPSGDENSPV